MKEGSFSTFNISSTVHKQSLDYKSFAKGNISSTFIN